MLLLNDKQLDISTVVGLNLPLLLHLACQCDNYELAKRLLFEGADPTLRDKVIDTQVSGDLFAE